MSEGQRNTCVALLSGDIHWDRVNHATEVHKVKPLVCRNILRLFAESIPDQVRAALQTELEALARRNLSLSVEMLRLSDRFRAEGLPAIPYKGPLLAAQAYGDLGLRQFVDLDFALLQRDLPRAAALLESEGYESTFGNLAPEEGSRPTRSEYQFRRSNGQFIVELQTETTLRYFPHPLDLDAMHARAKPVKLAGGETLGFSPEDLFILLSVHGAKHFWERLMWIADIAELVQASCGLEWPELFARSDEMGAGRMVRLALCLAYRLLDAPLPEIVLAQVRSDSVAIRLSDEISSRFSLTIAQVPILRRFQFRRAMREKFTDGVRYAIRLATSPTDPDRADLPLPGGMSGAHRWVRPLLLMRRYGIWGTKSR